MIIRHGDDKVKTKVYFQPHFNFLIFSFEILCDCWVSGDDGDHAGVHAHIALKQSRADTTPAAKSLISFTGGSSGTEAAT